MYLDQPLRQPQSQATSETSSFTLLRKLRMTALFMGVGGRLGGFVSLPPRQAKVHNLEPNPVE